MSSSSLPLGSGALVVHFNSLKFSPFLISKHHTPVGPWLLSDHFLCPKTRDSPKGWTCNPFSFLSTLPFLGICHSCHVVSMSMNPKLCSVSTSLPGSLFFFKLSLGILYFHSQHLPETQTLCNRTYYHSSANCFLLLGKEPET